MTPDQAAWVRQHVWPPIWQRLYEDIPGTFLDCACTKPPSLECQRGEHGDCRMHERGIHRETVIQTSRLRPARFLEPYVHAAAQWDVLAWVWLAGRPCRWICACACHTRPELVTAEPELAAWSSGLLFDLEAP